MIILLLSFIFISSAFSQDIVDSLPGEQIFILPKEKGKLNSWPYQKIETGYLIGYNYGGSPADIQKKHGNFQHRVIMDSNLVSPTDINELTEKEIKLSLKYILKNGSRILSKCFLPRHALIFYNEKKEIIATIDICFSCQTIIISPQIIELENKIYDGLNKKFELDKKMKSYFNHFKRMVLKYKMPYFKTEGEWFHYQEKQ